MTRLLGLLLLLQAPMAQAEGWLLVPELVTGRVEARFPGFEPPSIWVHDEQGRPLESRSGPFAVGKRVPLPEGFYQVEVGNVRAEKNRVKVFVEDGKTTVIPTGLVAVTVEPADEQPADVCPQWDSELYVYLPTPSEPGPMIAENRKARHERIGALQVVAGFYRIQWNRFWVTAEVKGGHVYQLETGLAGPMPADDYAVFDEKDVRSGGPNLKLCRSRPTRLLSRTYHGTYKRPTQKYPFRERMWEEITVQKPASRRGPYEPLRVPRVRGPVYSGPGAAPLMLWEVPPAEAPERGTEDDQEQEEAAPEEPAKRREPKRRGLPDAPRRPEVTPIPSP